MREKVKMLWGKVKEFFSKMKKKTRIALAVLFGIIVVGAIAIALVLNNRPYAVLFTGLGSDEISSIITYLNNSGITDYKVEGSNTVLVPEAQEAQLKADLLMQGYPKSGFAYETYRSGVSGMSTDADRQIAYLQDLQDRMAGVIRCMDGVRDAVVTIAEGEDHRYVLDSGNILEAKASVIVTLNSGATLSEQQATAIRNLVAHAVQGLEIGNIEISDSQGNVYSVGDSAAVSGDASQLKLQLEEKVNNKVRTQVMTALAPFFGEENIRVAVNSTVDVDHTWGESTHYTEPAWAADGSTNGEGIIGSKIYDQEFIRGADGTVGGVVGNQSNADINTYVENSAQVNGDETYIRNQGETNYNVDTDKKQVERIAGIVTDLSVSVSINRAVSGDVNVDMLMRHIARAAGIGADAQEDKISILVMPFYQAEKEPGLVTPAGLNLPAWALYAGIGGVALLLFILLLLLLLRKRRKKRKQAEVERIINSMPRPMGDAVEPEPEGGADIMNIRTEKSMLLRQDIRKFAESNPEIAAQMLKNWLRGGEENE